jgi:uncharacterized protein YxjI
MPPLREHRGVPSLFDDRTGVGVHQRRKFVELRNQYTLTDEAGETIGAVEQQRQSVLTFLARLTTSLDVVLPVTLAVTDANGAPALTLEKPWFTMRVTVRDETGTAIGVIGRKLRLGKPVYALSDTTGAPVGEIRAQDWRSRSFQVLDASERAFAHVTKQWRGLLTEVLTDADSYAVTFEPHASAAQRALAFAGALAVDLVQKQKDSGGGLLDV